MIIFNTNIILMTLLDNLSFEQTIQESQKNYKIISYISKIESLWIND